MGPGAVRHALRTTLPLMLWRASVALTGGVAAGLIFVTIVRIGFGLGLAPWIAGLIALVVLPALVWALAPLWISRVSVLHLRALGLVQRGATLPQGWDQVQEMQRQTTQDGGMALARLTLGMRHAHRDIIGLVQGLTVHLPPLVKENGPASQFWLRRLAGPMADLALAEVLSGEAETSHLPKQASDQVARSAERAHELVSGLVNWSILAALAVGATATVSAVLMFVVLADGNWTVWLAGTLILTAVLWFALVSPSLMAWAICARGQPQDAVPPPEPWLARLEASSKAYRCLQAWSHSRRAQKA